MSRSLLLALKKVSSQFNNGLAYRVGGGQIREVHRTAEELAVDDYWKADVQDDVVVDGQPKKQTYQLVLALTLQ